MSCEYQEVSMPIVRLTAILALLSTALSAQAEVKKEENTKAQFAGMLGKMIGMFGGKAADEGLRSVVAVKGDRKLTRTGDTGDLGCAVSLIPGQHDCWNASSGSAPIAVAQRAAQSAKAIFLLSTIKYLTPFPRVR
jgi:hypothetical protein